MDGATKQEGSKAVQPPSTTTTTNGTGFFLPRISAAAPAKQQSSKGQQRGAAAGRHTWGGADAAHQHQQHQQHQHHGPRFSCGGAHPYNSNSHHPSGGAGRCPSASSAASDVETFSDLTYASSSSGSFTPRTFAGSSSPYAPPAAVPAGSSPFLVQPRLKPPQLVVSRGPGVAAPPAPPALPCPTAVLPAAPGVAGSMSALMSDQELLLLQSQEADLDSAILNLLSLRQQLAARVQQQASYVAAAAGPQQPVALTGFAVGGMQQPQQLQLLPQQQPQQQVLVLVPADSAPLAQQQQQFSYLMPGQQLQQPQQFGVGGQFVSNQYVQVSGPTGMQAFAPTTATAFMPQQQLLQPLHVADQQLQLPAGLEAEMLHLLATV